MQRIKYLNTHKEVCSTHANGKTEDSSALLNCAEWRHLGIDSCTQTRCLRIVVVVIRSVAVCARAFNICVCVCVFNVLTTKLHMPVDGLDAVAAAHKLLAIQLIQTRQFNAHLFSCAAAAASHSSSSDYI